jgi:hypothetical protein
MVNPSHPYNRFHVVCWPSLIELLLVDEEMRRLHIDGEGEVHCVLNSWDKAGIGVGLVEIPDNDGAVTRTYVQVL